MKYIKFTTVLAISSQVVGAFLVEKGKRRMVVEELFIRQNFNCS